MSQACALLLSDMDYNLKANSDNNEEDVTNSNSATSESSSNPQKNSVGSAVSDKHRLFSLFRRCQTAASIIANSQQRQQHLPPPPNTGINKEGKTIKGSTLSKKSKQFSKPHMPLRGSRLNKSMPPQVTNNTLPTPSSANRRASSDESSSKSSGSTNNTSKQKQPSSSTKKGNPPASALAFLAALNKQQSSKQVKQTQSSDNLDSISVSSTTSTTPPSSPKIQLKSPLDHHQSPTQQSQTSGRKLRSHSPNPPIPTLVKTMADSKENTKSPSKDNNSTSSRLLRSQSSPTINTASSRPKQSIKEVEKSATSKRKRKLFTKEQSIVRVFEVGQDVQVHLEDNEMCNAIIKGKTVDDLYIVELDNGEVLDDICIDHIMDIE